ncbi:hypothetical protein y223_00053 [Bordetella phage PY223]
MAFGIFLRFDGAVRHAVNNNRVAFLPLATRQIGKRNADHRIVADDRGPCVWVYGLVILIEHRIG